MKQGRWQGQDEVPIALPAAAANQARSISMTESTPPKAFQIGMQCLITGCTTVALALISTAGLVAGMAFIATLTIAPIAQASTSQSTITLQRQSGESYDALIRRAELAARAAAQQSFDRNLLVTETHITILGESGGQVVPLLVLNVTRANWSDRPDPQQWATYFQAARALLSQPNPTPHERQPEPAAAPVPVQPAPTQSPTSQPQPRSS